MAQNPPGFRGVWRTDEAARAVYSEAAGIHRIEPQAVAVPSDAEDVATLVRWAAAEKLTLTPRGAGSSMAGAAVGAGVIVDLSGLDRIDPVNAAALAVRARPGALCGAIDAMARRSGLRFPVDPSSARFCTVGGMAATNAAGAHTLRFGPMRAWVEGVECVFADGCQGWVRRREAPPDIPAIARFEAVAPELRDAELRAPSRRPGVRKESSGYGLADWARSGSLVDLLVGSEGTLALFTALELRLTPLAGATGTLLAAFPTIEAAAAAAAIAAELNASACELLDRTFLEIARLGGSLPVPDDADCVLLVEVEESSPARLAELAAAIATGFRDAGASHAETTLDPARAAQLWRVRHAASPVLAAMGRAAISMQIIEDGAVPPARLPEYVRGVRAALVRHDFPGVLFGHAGDGHLHVNVLVDPALERWQQRVESLFSDVVVLTASLGGTLSGEHGDGRLRAGALSRLWPAATVARMQAVKQAFDPHGVLNPGVKFPAPGAPALGGQVKYDPGLPQLPIEARRALDRVQRERIWDRSRLTLLAEESVH